ncbi:peptidoglycan-binding domain-containing protein [Methylobacterium indicum]|uniref:peptidoglycan-binding domain-containing protein n=1 Tax=Methylobacterium indicum TaxID=1775910 RepID=UPI002435A5F0|nr:peptidoglycan-binding domain-containing protein [Methylobacterium indicum]
MTLLLSRDDAAVSVEALLAQAGRGLREAGLGVDDEAEGARPLAGAEGEGEAQGPDLAARSRRLTAEMEALDRTVRRRRDELDLVGASVARLRDAAEVDQENRRAAEAIRASADAGAAEARAGIEAVGREMAALRAQVAEQREALAAARMEADAARIALTALRAEIAGQAGRMEAARAEGEAGIRLVTDRLSELGRTARINREAIGRITGTIGSLQALSSRGLETARDPLVPERVSLVGGSEAARPLPDLKTRIAALKVALAETPDSGVGIAPEAPSWTEATLRPEQWRTIQNALARSGHYAGIPDGRPGAGTRAAIAPYQHGLGSAATGRLSPAQIARLLPLAPEGQPVAVR